VKLRGARKRRRPVSDKRTLNGEGRCEGRHNLAALAPDAVVRACELKHQGLSLRVIAARLGAPSDGDHLFRLKTTSDSN
jgi:poly(A) polymerase Pap1